MTANIESRQSSVSAKRVIDASPEILFDAWLTKEILEQWWGPAGFTTEVELLEPYAGGRFRFAMTAANGGVSYNAGVIVEAVRPARIVLEFTEHCNAGVPVGEQPQIAASRVTAEFEAYGSQTRIVITHSRLRQNFAPLAGTAWQQALLKLSAVLIPV